MFPYELLMKVKRQFDENRNGAYYVQRGSSMKIRTVPIKANNLLGFR